MTLEEVNAEIKKAELEVNAKQLKFIQNLVSGMTQTKAYVEAGYSEAGARQSAYFLLTNPDVHRLKCLYIDRRALINDASYKKMLNSMEEEAEADITPYLDRILSQKDYDEMPKAVRRLITSVKRKLRNVKNGDDWDEITEYEIKFADRHKIRTDWIALSGHKPQEKVDITSKGDKISGPDLSALTLEQLEALGRGTESP